MLPTTGAHSFGPQTREFASTTATLPRIRAAASLTGEFGGTALDRDTSQRASSAGWRSTHAGTSSPMSGDSLIAVTEMPASASDAQYRAIPAPISAAAAGDSSTGWPGVAMLG